MLEVKKVLCHIFMCDVEAVDMLQVYRCESVNVVVGWVQLVRVLLMMYESRGGQELIVKRKIKGMKQRIDDYAKDRVCYLMSGG